MCNIIMYVYIYKLDVYNYIYVTSKCQHPECSCHRPSLLRGRVWEKWFPAPVRIANWLQCGVPEIAQWFITAINGVSGGYNF